MQLSFVFFYLWENTLEMLEEIFEKLNEILVPSQSESYDEEELKEINIQCFTEPDEEFPFEHLIEKIEQNV